MSTLYPVTFHFLASAMADAIRASGCLRSDSIVAVSFGLAAHKAW